MKRDHDAIRAEIDRLKADGLVKPSDVVEVARDASSPLHGWFTWEDGEAAHQYRLIQARNLLLVYVTVEQPDSTPVQAFVSLTSDRVQAGGGYRAMADVLNDAELREQLLHDAFVQFRNMRRKYQHLQQLAKVWTAVDEVEAREGVANAA